MRFRRTLAGLLTVMVLSFSPFASRCEIRCNLKSVAGSCHGSSHGRQQGIMSAMAGMDHSAAKPGTAASAVFASQPEACKHHVCVQPLVALHPHMATLSIVPINVGLVSPDPLQFASERTTELISVRGPPSFRRATPVSLHTTLLI